jgi:pyruvate,water dikinase
MLVFLERRRRRFAVFLRVPHHEASQSDRDGLPSGNAVESIALDPKDFILISRGAPPEGVRFGEKGLRLLELGKMGIEVPDGVLLSVEYLARMIEALNLEEEIDFIIQQEREGKTKLHAEVLGLFENRRIPECFKRELDQALREIRGFDGKKTRFAVRSAAVGEDDELSSFAGQYSTYLDVPFTEIWCAIVRCYASWWTERAVVYRRRRKGSESDPMISIIVQRQLVPEFSGVLFTRHPFNGQDELIIESVEGLGEKLVSGEACPDRWNIHPVTLKVLSRNTNGNGGHARERHIQKLASRGRELEKKFGAGLDIEWSVEKNRMYLLQLRPITTLECGQAEAGPALELLTRNVYSRSIVEDLWSDCMTPMTASIVFREFVDFYTFKPSLKKIGLDDVAAENALRVEGGYGYLSAHAMGKLLEVLPPALRFRELKRVFPKGIRESVLETPFRPARFAKVLLRLPLLAADPVAFSPFTVPLLKRHLEKIERRMNEVDIVRYEKRDPLFYKRELERVLGLLKDLQVKNQWGYGYATLMTWTLYHFATRYAGLSEQWVLNNMTRIPENNTLELQRRIGAICDACDETFVNEMFLTEDTKQAWDRFRTGRPGHPVVVEIERFIKDFRFRSSNRDFIHPRWDEEPSIVLDLIRVVLSSRRDPAHSGERRGFGREPRGILTPFLLRYLVRRTKRFLALREDLRYGLDKAFYRIRRLLLRISELPAMRGIEQVEHGVFFLELSELRSILDGSRSIDSRLEVLARRREAYLRNREQSPPYYIKMKGKTARNLDALERQGKIFKGTAASPGKVSGIARIVSSDREFHKLKKGEILVAHNTDPGWTPLFLSAAGVVVEMGGILNHCAIVAREYGIPAVVGIKGATQRIPEGSRVKINGNTGVVKIVEGPPASPAPPASSRRGAFDS